MRSILEKFVVVLAVVVATGVIGGCESEPRTPMGTTAQQIAGNTSEYKGDVVTISGEVGEIYQPSVFSIGGQVFDDEVLVISTNPIAPVTGRTENQPLRERDLVQVTGIVEQFNRSELEQEYAIDLSDEVTEEFSGEAVVIAASSANPMAQVLVTPRTGPRQVSPYDATPVTGVSDVLGADEPRDFSGRLAVFTDVTVTGTVGDDAVWIASDAGRLFVVLPQVPEIPQPEKGEQWTMYGVLRDAPTHQEMIAEWDVPEDVATEIVKRQVYLKAVDVREVRS